MPKAGRYDYPATDLEESIVRVRKLYDTAKQAVIKRDVAAEILGMKKTSGWFSTLIGTMAMYGLISTREGEVTITELSKNILFGSESEKSAAMKEAAGKIELFADLYSQYGSNPTDEQVKIFLKQKGYMDIADAQSLAEKIGKLFKNSSYYLEAMDKKKTDSNETRQLTSDVSRPDTGEGRNTLPYESTPSDIEKFEMSDDFGIWVKRDKASIDFLKNQLKVLEAWLKHVEGKLGKVQGES